MKLFKRAATFLIAVALLLALTGCTSVERADDGSDTSMFVAVEKTSAWAIVYCKQTKVMYAVSYSTYNYGTFTLLVNADGTPMVYGG
jgi:uncharacterized lipoprotein YehR (DUF1307 family)